MIKSDIEPTEVLAEPPLPTPPAAQPADAEQQADQVVPQQADQVVPQQADQVVPQQADQVVPQQADQAMPHNPYAQSHVVPQQADQVVLQQANQVVPQQEKHVITFDYSDGRLPPPKVFLTAQEMYAELWETGKRLVSEGLTQKGSDPGAAIVATGGQLMGRAADGMQLFEIPGRSFSFLPGHPERTPGSGGAPS
jgi:hypothetical protein